MMNLNNVKQEAQTNIIELKIGGSDLLDDVIGFLYRDVFAYDPDERQAQAPCKCPSACCHHRAVYFAHAYVVAGQVMANSLMVLADNGQTFMTFLD
jgi:hypothetical protein